MLHSFKRFIRHLIDRPYQTGSIIHQQYKVKEILGIGSFGIVYYCTDINHPQTEVAIKQLRQSKGRSLKEVHFFQEEIKLLRSLKHPSIPKLINQFTYDNKWFYVMEAINGENLEALLFDRKKQFSEKQSLELIKELIDAVDYLHDHHVIHGDLRIPNIILKNNRPILIDFGLSISFKPSTPDRHQLIQDDYYDVADILLFLLYSTYPGKNKKALPWTEELSLQPTTTLLLKRLLGIEKKYADSSELLVDLEKAISECQ